MREKRSGKECHNRRGGSKYHLIIIFMSIYNQISISYEKFFVNFTISKLNQIVCGIADTDLPNSNKNHPCVEPFGIYDTKIYFGF